jgi:hypothetical protein
VRLSKLSEPANGYRERINLDLEWAPEWSLLSRRTRYAQHQLRLFQDKEPDVRYRATEALRGQLSLPSSALSALTQLLHDHHSPVRNGAAETPHQQDGLAGSVVKSLLPLLQSKDTTQRSCAILVLGGHAEFYSLIPTFDLSRFRNLLMSWLHLSFKKSVTCVICDGTLSIDIYGKTWRVTLQKEQEQEFLRRCLIAQSAIGVPPSATNAKGPIGSTNQNGCGSLGRPDTMNASESSSAELVFLYPLHRAHA